MWMSWPLCGPWDGSWTMVNVGEAEPLSSRQYMRLDGTWPWLEFSITDCPLIWVRIIPGLTPAWSAGLPLVTPSISRPPQRLPAVSGWETHGESDVPIQYVDW